MVMIEVNLEPISCSGKSLLTTLNPMDSINGLNSRWSVSHGIFCAINRVFVGCFRFESSIYFADYAGITMSIGVMLGLVFDD